MIRLPDWLNPWSANRRLRAQLVDADRLAEIAGEQYDRLRDANAELREALNMMREHNTALWDKAVQLSDDRNRLRDANAELREALTLYRDAD